MENREINIVATRHAASLLRLPLACLMAAAIAFAACKSDNDPEPTPAVQPSLSATPEESIPAGYAAGTYAIAVTSNTTWTAAVSPETAGWCTLTNASATGNGTITVNVTENPTIDERAATATITCGTLACAVAVTQAGAPAPPPHAASTQTWVFGEQTWSDAIHCPGCNKTDFTLYTSDYPPQTIEDCRSYTSGTATWYYYTWSYVDAHKDEMCPTPWRVPTKADFEALVNNAGYTELVSAWGHGGDVGMDNKIWYDNSQAYFWSSERWDSNPTLAAYSLTYYRSGNDYTEVKQSSFAWGHRVICVR